MYPIPSNQRSPLNSISTNRDRLNQNPPKNDRPNSISITCDRLKPNLSKRDRLSTQSQQPAIAKNITHQQAIAPQLNLNTRDHL